MKTLVDFLSGRRHRQLVEIGLVLIRVYCVRLILSDIATIYDLYQTETLLNICYSHLKDLESLTFIYKIVDYIRAKIYLHRLAHEPSVLHY